MEIGKPKRIYTIEPIVDPVPSEPEHEPEPAPMPERRAEPDELPTRPW